MKKMRIVNLLIVIMLLFSCQNNEQFVSISQNSISIAMQIYAINSKIPLSDESILRLKDFFIKNDSIAEIEFSKGKSLDEITQWYYPSIKTIAAQLTPLERNDYIIYQKYNRPQLPYVSELRVVVKYRQEINLSHIQIERLLYHSEEIEKRFGSQDCKHGSVERQYLANILSDIQYKAFFIIRKTQHAEEIATQQWKLIQMHQLCSKSSDSLVIMKQLYEYEREKSGILEYMSSIGNNKGYDKERSRLNAHKPLLLLKLETLEPSSHNRLLDIICKREILKLTEQQIEQLLREYYHIMQAEYKAIYENKPESGEVKFKRSKLEGKCLLNIISHQQIEDYFILISQGRAKEQALWHWDELKDCDFVNKNDSAKLVGELANYELRLSVAEQWILLENSRKYLFVREDVLNERPEILKKKEEWKKKEKERKIIRF